MDMSNNSITYALPSHFIRRQQLLKVTDLNLAIQLQKISQNKLTPLIEQNDPKHRPQKHNPKIIKMEPSKIHLTVLPIKIIIKRQVNCKSSKKTH